MSLASLEKDPLDRDSLMSSKDPLMAPPSGEMLREKATFVEAVQRKISDIRERRQEPDLQSTSPGLVATLRTADVERIVAWTNATDVMVMGNGSHPHGQTPRVDTAGVREGFSRLRLDKAAYDVTGLGLVVRFYPTAVFDENGLNIEETQAQNPTPPIVPTTCVEEIIGHEGDYFAGPTAVFS